MDKIYIYSGVSNNFKQCKAHQPGMFEVKTTEDGLDFYTSVYIKEVIYNNPATVVLWSDGTKTIAKCTEGDTYSKEFGLTLCIMKKLVGGAKVYNIFENWISGDNRVTLRDVRKKSRE